MLHIKYTLTFKFINFIRQNHQFSTRYYKTLWIEVCNINLPYSRDSTNMIFFFTKEINRKLKKKKKFENNDTPKLQKREEEIIFIQFLR